MGGGGRHPTDTPASDCSAQVAMAHPPAKGSHTFERRLGDGGGLPDAADPRRAEPARDAPERRRAVPRTDRADRGLGDGDLRRAMDARWARSQSSLCMGFCGCQGSTAGGTTAISTGSISSSRISRLRLVASVMLWAICIGESNV